MHAGRRAGTAFDCVLESVWLTNTMSNLTECDSTLWKLLRVGDRVRLVEIPAEFLQVGYCIHRDTLRVNRKLVARGRPFRICRIDGAGCPWIRCRIRRKDGRLDHHL